MALNQIGLGMVITARDMASGVMNRIGGSFTRMTRSMDRSSRAVQASMALSNVGVRTLATGVGLLGATWGAARESAAFGQGIARVGAISRATNAELSQLRDRAIQAGIATQFSPVEATQGLAELAIRGFNASESMRSLSSVLDLAAGGQISVAQSSQTVGSALRAFNIGVDQAGITTDKLLRITNTTALQANELAISLGNVARGAGNAQQGLDEMLISIGLTRNTGVQASVAANSVSSALLYMANQGRQRFRRLGVDLEDAGGNFRNFLDIVLDAETALARDFPRAADRASQRAQLYGRFGLTAARAIADQLREGVRTSTGQLLRGADAVRYLRNQLATAQGAAQEFREILLDTLDGQILLIKGTLQTLAVVVGEPFARVFRPAVDIITRFLNIIIRLVNAMPKSAQTAIAAMVVLTGILIALTGAGVIFGATLAIIIPLLKVIVVTMTILAAAAAPVVVVFGALAAGSALFYSAFKRDIGGIRSTFTAAFKDIKLAYDAVVSLLTTGRLSGSLRDELRRAEHAGVRRFAINIARIIKRIQEFFKGLRKGFEIGLAAAAPAFREASAAINDLGAALGLFQQQGSEAITGIPLQTFGEQGSRVGQVLAAAAEYVAHAVRFASKIVQGFIENWGYIRSIATPAINQLKATFEVFRPVLASLVREFGAMIGVVDTSNKGGMRLGQTLAGMVGVGIRWVVIGLIMLMRATMKVIGFFQSLDRGLTILKNSALAAGSIIMAVFAEIRASIENSVDSMIAAIARLAAAIPPAFRPGFLTQVVEAGGAAETRVAERARASAVRRRNVERELAMVSGTGQAGRGDVTGAGLMGAAVSNAQMSELINTMTRTAASQERVSRQPIHIQIDGETVARATRGATRSEAEASFRPIGVES